VAKDLMGVLAAQAGRGMNVVTVIHQPRLSIYTMFDTVALLHKGQVGVWGVGG
jgi:ABC-type multidrug transport system ATPase subunit